MYFEWTKESMGQDTSFPKNGLRQLSFVKHRLTSCLLELTSFFWVDTMESISEGDTFYRSYGKIVW